MGWAAEPDSIRLRWAGEEDIAQRPRGPESVGLCENSWATECKILRAWWARESNLARRHLSP